MYICVYMYIYIYMYIYAYMCIYIYIYTYTHIHVYTNQVSDARTLDTESPLEENLTPPASGVDR